MARAAPLERVRHGRDVRLQQEVSREIAVDIEELEAGDPAARWLEPHGLREAGVDPEPATQ